MYTIRRLLAVALGLPFFHAVAAPPRPLQVSDLFEFESVTRLYDGPFAFSPDGKAVAFTLARKPSTWTNHRLGFFWGNAHADVWVHHDGAARRLTDGLADHSGWCAPTWSPDGQRVALVRIDEKGTPHFYVWESSTGKARPLPGLRRPHLNLIYKRPYAWLDARRLLCAEIGDGIPLVGSVETRAQDVAPSLWEASARGKTVTVSALDSGIPVDMSKTPPSRLLVIDVESGAQRTLVSRVTTEWMLSPSQGHVAHCYQTGQVQVRDGVPLPLRVSEISQLEIVGVDGASVSLAGPTPEDVIINSLRWSEDSRKLAFVAFAHSGDERPALFVADLDARRLERWNTGDLDVAPIPRGQVEVEWVDRDEILIRGVPYTGAWRAAPDARRDWWRVSHTGNPVNVSSGLPAVPSQLWRDQARSFLGVAGGALHAIDPHGAARTLGIPSVPKIRSIAWPAAGLGQTHRYAPVNERYDRFVLATPDGELHQLDLRSLVTTPIARPTADAVLREYRPDGQAVFGEDSKRGTFLWRMGVGGTEKILETNTFVAGIAESPVRYFTYTSLAGEKLNAAAFLPPDYQPGRKYPTIVRVYPGHVVTDRIRGDDSITNDSIWNVHLLPARGFILLIPSLPLKPEGVADDVLARLPEGVLPAVDAAVAAGISDPDRIFLLGHSSGGYAAYGLVTQTHRFKAAVSLAGISNLVSYYGTYDPRTRYMGDTHHHYYHQALAETGSFHLMQPPWRDPERYARNSPINFVDRVRTPLLIEYGDVDYVPMTQGEEFFSSLVRQGKRARFLRYWGEGHVLTSPANIADLFREVVAWYDEFGDISRGPDGLPRYDGDRVASSKSVSP